MGFPKAGWKGLVVIALVFSAQQFGSRAAITFENDPFTISEGAGAIDLKTTRNGATGALAFDYRITFNGAEV